VTVIGSGSGIPFKIDSGGSVRDARAGTLDYFVGTTDTFGGNSGSGVYENNGYTVAGILVRGEIDYRSNGSCNVVNTCAETGCRGEDITYVRPAIDAYCEVATSARLCTGYPRHPTPVTFTFTATNTNSASQNTVNHDVNLVAGQTLRFGTCTVPGSFGTGDTYLRLFNGATQVASNDDACGVLSYASFTATTAGTYQIRAGCFSSGSCSGTVAYTISSGCAGKTQQGATAWQQYDANAIYLDVNTAECGFNETPLYFTSLGGLSNHYVSSGATAIYSPSPTGFRVYVNHEGITPARANNEFGWHLNWQATPNNLRQPSSCTGKTQQGATAWQQYDANAVYLDVNTAECGFSGTPLYITSLGGLGSHYVSSGATAIYSPSPTGFRVYVRYSYPGGVTPARANNEFGWHLNWQATPNNLRQPSSCTGKTQQGATAWQQYDANAVYLDVNTAECGFSGTPLYFTSLGGLGSHYVSSGATAIYSPSPTGFRVYVRYSYPGGVTPARANNEFGWHLNWNARTR
jgi:hypothetical protein